jgi:hypothetical protein
VIRLAYQKPDLRPTLLPLLKTAKGFNPEQYGLEGLLRGDLTTLFHGTTASFKVFDLTLSRDELVDQFYGKALFFTPSKHVAERYANANRNMGLPRSVLSDLKRANPHAGAFLQALYDKGADAWEEFARDHGFWNDNPAPGDGTFDSTGFEEYLGVDGNTLMDISQHILGTKYNARGPDELEELMGVFNPSTGSPDWVYSNLDEVGLDSGVYRPKVYTVAVKVENTLVTASKSEARSARGKGYDSVVYHGPDLVGGIPEVAVYDPRKVRILRVEVV